ncbi:hypothetical protein D3C76_830180 [compost metagenome]
MNERLIFALQAVRDGTPDKYQEGINFGVALGIACTYPYEQQCRINTLILNASKYARLERAARRHAA